jgi:hydrogenase 3 maturation protease
MDILMGIGNTLRCDDGIGPYIAQQMQGGSFLSLDCGTVPENFTSVVRKIRPGLLLLIDAADMGIAPGEFRSIPKQHIKEVSIGSHNMPLSFLIDYISDSCGTILFIGIQPGTIADGEARSEEVLAGAALLIEILERGAFEKIQPFVPENRLSPGSAR